MVIFSGTDGMKGPDPPIADKSIESLRLWTEQNFIYETVVDKKELDVELGVIIHRQVYKVHGRGAFIPGAGGDGGIGGIGGIPGKLLLIGLGRKPNLNTEINKGNVKFLLWMKIFSSSIWMEEVKHVLSLITTST